MNSSLIQILVLAGIAIFLILKLRSVLGSRDGFEKPVAPRDAPRTLGRGDLEVIEGGPDLDISDHVPENSASAAALAQMKVAEPSFVVTPFLQGARQAYEMILMAFQHGDLGPVRSFLSDEVAASFSEGIEARKRDGLTIEATFVGLKEMTLEEATFDSSSGIAEITVRFIAELTSVVRNQSGEVIEGSPTAIKRQSDLWSFSRRMGANDPNWQLSATGG